MGEFASMLTSPELKVDDVLTSTCKWINQTSLQTNTTEAV